jgi:hypothetical protein
MAKALHVLRRSVHNKESKQKAQQQLRVNVSSTPLGGPQAGPAAGLGSDSVMLLDRPLGRGLAATTAATRNPNPCLAAWRSSMKSCVMSKPRYLAMHKLDAYLAWLMVHIRAASACLINYHAQQRQSQDA